MSKRTVALLAAALVLTPLGIAAVGDLDRTFGGDGKVVTDFGADDYPFDVAVQRDGKIVVVGVSYLDVGSAFWIARYTGAGALDASFGSGGIIRPDFGAAGSGNAVIIQADGKIVVAGWAYENGTSGNFALVRYDGQGHLDPSFGGSGTVLTPVAAPTKPDQATAVVLQSDPRIPAVRVLVAGYASGSNSDFAVTRFWR